MSNSELVRTYYFSDTYGGPSGIFEAPDPDALITTDFRSRPFAKTHREFDTFDRPKVTDHILRTVLRLHGEVERCRHLTRQQIEENLGVTGILINSAPRMTTGENGDDFYLAQCLRGSVRVVAPISALSAIKQHVDGLQRLPNEDNNLYDGTREQFRSSYAAVLLDPKLDAEHKIPLEDVEPSEIPNPYPKGWHLSYVDRFGNMVTFRPQKNGPLSLPDTFRLRIGTAVCYVLKGSCLAQAEPGEISVYSNDGSENVEIIRKWKPGETGQRLLDNSAYVQFNKPQLGTVVKITE